MSATPYFDFLQELRGMPVPAAEEQVVEAPVVEAPVDLRCACASEVDALRDELAMLVIECFVFENLCWTLANLDAELEDAMTGMPASLVPNVLHYRELVAGVHAEIIARELAAARIFVVTAEALARRRSCHPSCDSKSCVGKRISCSRDGIAPPTVLN